MRAHYLQHVPFEGLGSIEPWLIAHGYEITCSRLFESAELPDLAEVDLLIVMGGSMSVNDEKEFQWLVAEKHYIREAIYFKKPLLGICLGAQLIASAMGASVYRNSVKEIGWYPVFKAESVTAAQFNFPSELTAFHWHGETFDLPTGAVRLAQSEGCVNQAFQLGSSVIGLQCHLETTQKSIQELIFHCKDELVPGQFIQTEAEILSKNSESYNAINQLMGDILSFLVKKE